MDTVLNKSQTLQKPLFSTDQKEKDKEKLSGSVREPLLKNVLEDLPEGSALLPEEEKVEVNAPAEGTFVEEPAPQYIGFDEAYIMENRQDSSRMKAVRSALKTYMEMKNALATVPEGKKQYHLEGMINALVDLKVMCRSYSFFRHSFFSYGQTRKREVQKVLRDAEAEMARVQRDYFTFLEQEFRTRAHTDPAIRKRRVASKAVLPEIKLGEKSWNKRKLQLDDLNKQVTNTDYKIHSVKTYLKLKSSFDLKNSGLEFTEEEKKLLEKIHEYGATKPAEREIGGTRGFFAKIFTLPGLKDRQKKERNLYSELQTELKGMLSETSQITAEKRALFQGYLNLLCDNTKGTLELTPEQRTQIHDDVRGVQYRNSSKKRSDGRFSYYTLEEKQYTTGNHAGEPLFAHPPTSSDIVQGDMGNCFLLSSIAELAASDPKQITDMFQEDGDQVIVRLFHTYTDKSDASIPGGQEKTKPVFFKIDKTVADSANKGALWVNLLCKAFCCYHLHYPDNLDFQLSANKEFYKAQHEEYGRYKLIDYGFISNGGRSDTVSAILTGRKKQPPVLLRGTVSEAGTADKVLELAYREEHTKEERERMEKDGSVFDLDFAVCNTDQISNILYIKECCEPVLQKRKQDREELFRRIREYKTNFHAMEEKAKTQNTYDEMKEVQDLRLELVREKKALKEMYNEYYLMHPENTPDWSLKGHAFDEKKENEEAIKADLSFIGLISNLAREVMTWVEKRLDRTGPPKKEDFLKMNQLIQEEQGRIRIPEQLQEQFQRCMKALGKSKTELMRLLLQYAIKADQLADEKFDAVKDTGKHEIFTGNYTEEALEVFEKIKDCRKKGLSVGAGTREGTGNETETGEVQEDGLLGGHAYTILGATEVLYEGKRIKMIRLRNPWGSYAPEYMKNEKTGKVEAVAKEEADGEFLCELTHFVQKFKAVYSTGK